MKKPPEKTTIQQGIDMTCKMRSKLTTVSSVFAVVACVGLSGRAMAQDWSTLNLQNAGPYSDVGGTWQESDGIL